MQPKFIIVSNRLPVSVEKKGSELHFYPSAGGLATGLGSFYREYGALWIGWPGVVPTKQQQKEIEARLISEFDCYPVFLRESLAGQYYGGFVNKTLWPLFHSFPSLAQYSASEWEAYQEVNQRFCECIVEIAKPDATIWVHDYQLLLLPRYLRERLPNAAIGWFLHIPFPPYDILRLLPWHREILESLLAADLIGFHTYDYAQSFLRSVRRSLGYDHSIGQIAAGRRLVQVDVFPMGIDFLKFSSGTQSAQAQDEMAKIQAMMRSQKLVFSVSRLDYTKGIAQSLEVVDEFFAKYPEWRGKVIYVTVVVPSRETVGRYAQLKREIDELVGRINSRYGTLDWMPVRYLYCHLAFHELIAIYANANVALIIPLRDGMNLIAKEYIATRNDGKGCLILSETAGAAKELREALLVNPNNRGEVIEALREALLMPEDEQVRRNCIMRARLENYTAKAWAERFLQRLVEVTSLSKTLSVRLLSPGNQERLLEEYGKAERRLFLLDYDGTLAPLVDEPAKAKPTKHILELLTELASDAKNELILLSGRDRQTLKGWFGHLDLTLVAEHGAWLKRRKEVEWELIVNADDEWKERIRPILQLFVDRIPGSFIEEKDLSLVWHYRRADPETGADAAKELIDVLTNLTANLDLHVVPGSKAVEIKSSRISKGSFYARHLAAERWDFMLAVGDDWTDEELFSRLPTGCYSFRVGIAPSLARFNLQFPDEVYALLENLIHTAERS